MSVVGASALLRHQRRHIFMPFLRVHVHRSTAISTADLCRMIHTVRVSAPLAHRIIQKRFFRMTARVDQVSAPGGGGGSGGGGMPEDPLKKLWPFLIIGGILMFITTIVRKRGEGSANLTQPHFVSWNDFIHEMLAKGEVEEVVVRPDLDYVMIKLYSNAIYRGRATTVPYFQMRIANVKHFERQLRKTEEQLGIPSDKGVSVVYERVYSGEWITLAILIVASYFIYRRLSRNQPNATKGALGGFDIFGGMRKAKFRLVDPLTFGATPKVKFSDVVGLHEAKVEVKEFVDYLKRPDAYMKLGAKLPKGALLLGPPGCGKTLLAKAVATEANVPFMAMNGTEFVEMIGGLGAARVRDLFSEAKRRAPCIIYIDEIDAVGRKRSGDSGSGMDGMSNSEEEQTLNQLLVEMDGMDSAQGVIIIASTNRPDILDKALLRPGRFDRHISIDLPTLIERREIFEYYLKKIKLDTPAEQFALRLAQLTPGMSGADINNISNEAAVHAATAGQTSVTDKDLSFALDRILSGPEKKSAKLVPEDRQVIAYHESGHALVGWMLEHTDLLLKVSIVPRTVAALGFAQYNPQDRKLYSREELFDRMCMTLGGRAAESVKFGRITTGAEDDLRKVTRIAYDQIRTYGMSEKIGPLSFESMAGENRQMQFFKKAYSKKFQSLIDHEASQLVGQAYRQAESILKTHRDKLDLLAETLLKKEVLTFEEIKNLIGPPPFGHKNMVENLDLSLPTPQYSAEESDAPSEIPAEKRNEDS